MQVSKSIFSLLMVLIMSASCGDDEISVVETATLNIAYKMTYQGEPLVVTTKSYVHDGTPIIFKRLSFFVTDMVMSNESGQLVLHDIAYLNLTDSHANPELSQVGLVQSFVDVPVGTYSNLKYNIGVNSETNVTVPADYTSPPLNDTREYWADWNSYIFVKIEGALDFDKSGDFESPFVMHLGSDNAFRPKAFTNNVTINSNETSNLDLTIDVFDIFNNGNQAYDFTAVPRTHSLDFLDEINFVADGLARATSSN